MRLTQRIAQPCTTCNHERHSTSTYLPCTAGTKFGPSLRMCLPHTCRNLQSLLLVPQCHLHRECIVSDQRCPEICRLDTQCMLPRCCSSKICQPRNPGTYCRMWRCLHDSRIVLGCTCDGRCKNPTEYLRSICHQCMWCTSWILRANTFLQSTTSMKPTCRCTRRTAQLDTRGKRNSSKIDLSRNWRMDSSACAEVGHTLSSLLLCAKPQYRVRSFSC